jgi:hypothetical protein
LAKWWCLLFCTRPSLRVLCFATSSTVKKKTCCSTHYLISEPCKYLDLPTGKWVVMYLCAKSIDFASFYNFDIWLWTVILLQKNSKFQFYSLLLGPTQDRTHGLSITVNHYTNTESVINQEAIEITGIHKVNIKQMLSI